MLADVQQSFFPLPAGRPIKQLRIFQVLPKTHTHVANQPRLGYANAESARMLLGTVPVEEDGSAYFRAPARKPLYFQAVDADGRAVQTMRSVAYLQPGERRGCVGCHERPGTVAANRALLAVRRPPSAITPGPPGTRPLSFPLLVQPVLDRHCVRCHDGQAGPGKSQLALTGQVQDEFTQSYQNLKPFVRWNEWGGASLNQTATRPGRGGADQSPLTQVLGDATHGSAIASARRRPSPAVSVAGRQCAVLWHVHGAGAAGPTARRSGAAAASSIGRAWCHSRRGNTGAMTNDEIPNDEIPNDERMTKHECRMARTGDVRGRPLFPFFLEGVSTMRASNERKGSAEAVRMAVKPCGVTRRSFLGGTAAAIAFPCIVPAEVLGRNGAVPPSGRVALGIIGTGGRGTANMKSFLPLADAQVVAVCDVRRDAAPASGRNRGPTLR